MKRRSAFTLVEIMIVVAIIGLLAAIAIPSFENARARDEINRISSLHHIEIPDTIKQKPPQEQLEWLQQAVSNGVTETAKRILPESDPNLPDISYEGKIVVLTKTNGYWRIKTDDGFFLTIQANRVRLSVSDTNEK